MIFAIGAYKGFVKVQCNPKSVCSADQTVSFLSDHEHQKQGVSHFRPVLSSRMLGLPSLPWGRLLFICQVECLHTLTCECVNHL
jgi:hypothetical protein